MSGGAREWVWEHSTSRGTARLVLLSIADRVPDAQCAAWASLASLIERTQASRTAVRSALDTLTKGTDLDVVEHLQGPQRTTVYRLPLAAAHLAGDPDAPPPKLQDEELRQYGIWPRKGADSGTSTRNATGADSGPPRQNPTRRRAGFRPSEGADSGPQNRSEPKVNRNSRAAVLPATEWQVDQPTHTWAREHGHLDRLGKEGLRAADEKWRAHRATWPPRSAAAWAADWRSWVAREHASGRPNLYAVPGSGPAPTGGMTRTEAHTAALLAALGEPTGTE
ncbi:helix-turn-helix domain-containing protein [Streptomyces sp. NPDC004111]|uniref:helix-turn-helix domain-containing protein n=1 Tax=Streptomyces sp. NPDC004111 TaxID=3364690 RepID=UPI0036A0D977